MTLDPRAIAVEGVGYAPEVLAVLGWHVFDITVIDTSVDGVGGQRREERARIIMRVRWGERVITKTYDLEGGAAYAVLRGANISSKAAKLTAQVTTIAKVPFTVAAKLLK